MRKILLLALIFSSTAYAQGITSEKGFTIVPYGFIRVSSSFADGALASFGNVNAVAPTHAATQTTNTLRDSRLSFQTQQTRMGLRFKKDENLRAHLEFDFLDFNKSSPTTQMSPRVRIASVTYEFENHKFIFGQDWDMFSPVAAFTYNYVGNFFLAGNSGFMRQQAQYLNTQGKWEFGAALGMAGSNPGIADGDLELSKAPSYVLRAQRKLENGRIGVSGIYARGHYEVNESTHDSYGGNFFFEKSMGLFTVMGEAYYGQNMANLGTLTLGKGTATENVKEYGGFISGKYKLSPKQLLHLTVGMAKIDNATSVDAAIPTLASSGLLNNTVMRFLYEYKMTEDLSWNVELSRYETKAKLNNGNKISRAHQIDAGLQLRF